MSGMFTWGSDEGVAAVIAALPDQYDMSLNRADMTTVIDALLARHEAVVNEGDETGDRAGDLLSSIAETVGVEWV